LFGGAGVGGTNPIPGGPGSERCGRGGCSAREGAAVLPQFRFQSSTLFPASRKASFARAQQTAKLVERSLGISGVVGERWRGGRSLGAALPPGAAGSGVNGPAPLPLRSPPPAAALPPAQPGGGSGCARCSTPGHFGARWRQRELLRLGTRPSRTGATAKLRGWGGKLCRLSASCKTRESLGNE